MKKRRIVYSPTWQHGPMTYWVHLPADGKPWHDARVFDPLLEPFVTASGASRRVEPRSAW